MSISAAVQPAGVASPPVHRPAGDPATQAAPSEPVVEVLFPLVDDEEWPPYPAEMLDATLIAHDLAEIRGVPWFVTELSRGDIVRVRHDGIGYVGGAVVSRGGHSTLHVMATTDAELVPVVEQLQALGAITRNGLEPPMLTVDVPERVALQDVVDVLAKAESLTCAYTVACEQHRARR